MAIAQGSYGQSSLFEKHVVIFFAVLIEAIILHGHEDRFLKILLVKSVIIYRDLCGGSTVESIEDI